MEDDFKYGVMETYLGGTLIWGVVRKADLAIIASCPSYGGAVAVCESLNDDLDTGCYAANEWAKYYRDQRDEARSERDGARFQRDVYRKVLEDGIATINKVLTLSDRDDEIDDAWDGMVQTPNA
jgi:hypothetical protein